MNADLRTWRSYFKTSEDVKQRSAFFPADAEHWGDGDGATTEAAEAMRRTHWPVVESQRLWLAVVEQAVEESLHRNPLISGPAREFILSRSFRAVVGAVALRSRERWSVTAIREALRRVWR